MNRPTPGAALLVVLAIAASSARAEDPKSDRETGQENGWVALFNGKDLDGWEVYDGKGKAEIDGHWKVEDGVIHSSGTASHLFSPRGDYKNFRYRVELKINDKGNSGMYFRTKKGPGFPKGYEAQVNSTHGDPARTGTLYGFVPVKEMLVPPDTWFTQEVEAIGNHIVIKVDGKPVVDFTDPKSTYMEGFFAFQHHDPTCHVQVRKVEVMELPDSPAK